MVASPISRARSTRRSTGSLTPLPRSNNLGDMGLAAREINMGADDLSKRTEDPGILPLEETAAATGRGTRKASAQASKEAARIFDGGDAGGRAVSIAGQAVDAMAPDRSACTRSRTSSG